METSSDRTPTPEEAAAALRDAESSRDRLSAELLLPPLFHLSMGGAIGVQILTAAIGIAKQSVAGTGLAVVGAIVFLAVAAAQLMWFRRHNGAWLGGFASRVVFGNGVLASTAYSLALAVAVWSAFDKVWWITVIASAAGGAAYAAAGMQWMHSYRRDPARRGPGDSVLVLGLMAVPLVAGAVLLVIGH